MEHPRVVTPEPIEVNHSGKTIVVSSYQIKHPSFVAFRITEKSNELNDGYNTPLFLEIKNQNDFARALHLYRVGRFNKTPGKDRPTSSLTSPQLRRVFLQIDTSRTEFDSRQMRYDTVREICQVSCYYFVASFVCSALILFSYRFPTVSANAPRKLPPTRCNPG